MLGPQIGVHLWRVSTYGRCSLPVVRLKLIHALELLTTASTFKKKYINKFFNQNLGTWCKERLQCSLHEEQGHVIG